MHIGFVSQVNRARHTGERGEGGGGCTEGESRGRFYGDVRYFNVTSSA